MKNPELIRTWQKPKGPIEKGIDVMLAESDALIISALAILVMTVCAPFIIGRHIIKELTKEK